MRTHTDEGRAYVSSPPVTIVLVEVDLLRLLVEVRLRSVASSLPHRRLVQTGDTAHTRRWEGEEATNNSPRQHEPLIADTVHAACGSRSLFDLART